MAYSLKAHTRATSHDFLDHILSLFGTQAVEIKLALEQEVLLTLMDFIGTPIDDLVTMEWNDEEDKTHKLNRPTIRLLKNIHAWILWEEKNRSGIDYMTMVMDDFDKFLLVRNQPATTMNTMITTSPPAATIIPTNTPQTTALMHNVKLDVKQYPTFNGD